MWKAQRVFIPKDIIPIFSKKSLFNERFNELMRGGGLNFKWPSDCRKLIYFLPDQDSQAWFVKPEHGQCGQGGFKLVVSPNETFDEINDHLKNRLQPGGYILEKYLVNHHELKYVNPSSLNTVRVVTYTDGYDADILFSRVRFGYGKDVDNLGAGGFAAEVDCETGSVTGKAVSTSSGFAKFFDKHPLTDVRFDKIKVPMWNEVIHLAKNAALIEPKARIVGWDIAVTDNGVFLIEGNHNWCKLLWQLPVGKGLKRDLDTYIERICSRVS